MAVVEPTLPMRLTGFLKNITNDTCRGRKGLHKAGKGRAQCALITQCFLNGNPPYHTQLRPLKVRSRTTTATLVKIPHRTAVLMKLPLKNDHHALNRQQLCRRTGRAGFGAF